MRLFVGMAFKPERPEVRLPAKQIRLSDGQHVRSYQTTVAPFCFPFGSLASLAGTCLRGASRSTRSGTLPFGLSCKTPYASTVPITCVQAFVHGSVGTSAACPLRPSRLAQRQWFTFTVGHIVCHPAWGCFAHDPSSEDWCRLFCACVCAVQHIPASVNSSAVRVCRDRE